MAIDFAFMRDWPPRLRWFLVLPAACTGAFLIQFATKIVLFLVPPNAFRSALTMVLATVQLAVFVVCGSAAAPRAKPTMAGALALFALGTYVVLLAVASRLISFTPAIVHKFYRSAGELIVGVLAGLVIVYAAGRRIGNDELRLRD